MTSYYARPGAPFAEQLCVTTAIIGLLAVGGKAIDYLDERNLTFRGETAVFHRALQEVKQCRSAAHILYKTFSLLESGQLPFPDRPAWIQVDNLIVTLTDTVLAISDLHVAIESLEQKQTHSHSRSHSASDRAEYAQKLTGLCTRIHWHNLSMTMMMTILKCPGESDAQNCRVGLERRMTRLLSSNAELAARLRRLRDLYGIRATARATIPSHAPIAETAPRLPADTTPSSPQSLASTSSAYASGPQLRNDATNQQVTRPKSWSVLSGYSLDDIPVLSMVPLPVTTLELGQGQTFYTFDFARRVSHDLVELMQSGQGTSRMLRAILDKPIANGIANGHAQSVGDPPMDDLSSDMFDMGTGSPEVANETSTPPDEKTSKGFKNPLLYRIRRRLK